MSRGKVLSKDTYYKVIPLALILLIVPLIVRYKDVTLTGAALEFSPNSGSYSDFFNYYKAMWLGVFTILGFLSCLWYISSRKITFSYAKLFIPLGVYYLCVIISTLFSSYKQQAIFGYNDRFEGLLIITCYLTTCFIAAHFITYEKDIKVLFGALIVSASIISILGISQFWGFDFLQSNFGKQIMLSAKEYKEIGEILEFKFPNRYIYATLYNPNYVGSYFAMLFPISVVLFLYTDTIKKKILSGLFCGITFITLVGCLSTTGYLGAFFATLFLLIILHKKVIKSWASVIPLVICLVAIFCVMNVTAEGNLIPDLNSKSTKIEDNVSNSELYKPNNSLKDIKLDKNTASIVMVDSILNITFDNSNYQCHFTNSEGKDIKFRIDESDNKTITFEDPQYEGVKLIIDGAVFNITTSNTAFNICINKETGSFKFLDYRGNQVDIRAAESYGFENRETFASSRGYIWARTIPLLKNTIFKGHGPDTFVYYFPQNDVISKVKAFNTPYMIVDKPHNMYLQVAVNTGLLSLLALLILIIWYVIESMRLYILNKSENLYYVSGVCCLVGVIGFMVSGLANDSVISVSPVFWILLGIGIASNRLYKKSIDNTNQKSGGVPLKMD